MRKHYLDNIRSLTIILVVIFHVIYIFNGVQPFGVIGPFKEIQYQDSLLYFLYPWFMVLLFVISGMSSRYYLENHSDHDFIKSRTRKLLVPGTIGILLFGWIQGYFNILISGGFETFSNAPKIIKFIILDLSGISVLWFVQILWIFSILLVLIRKIEKDKLYKYCEKCGIISLLLLTIPIYFAAQILNTPIITVYRFGIYGLTYFIGYFILSHEKVINKLSKYYLPLMIVSIILGITYTVLYFKENYALEPYINNFLAISYSWLMSISIISFMKIYGDKQNSLTKWMKKKSFGLYIFHYLPLSIVAWFLHIYAYSLPAIYHYLLTLIASFVFGILLYEIVSRIPIIRWCILGIKKE